MRFYDKVPKKRFNVRHDLSNIIFYTEIKIELFLYRKVYLMFLLASHYLYMNWKFVNSNVLNSYASMFIFFTYLLSLIVKNGRYSHLIL